MKRQPTGALGLGQAAIECHLALSYIWRMETDPRAERIQAIEQFKAAVDEAFGFTVLLSGKLDRRHAIMLAVVLTISALGGVAEWADFVG